MKYYLRFAATTLLFVAAVWADFVRYYVGFDIPQEILLFLVVAIAIALLAIYPAEGGCALTKNDVTKAATILVAFCTVLLIALFRGHSLKDCTLAYAPCVAFFFSVTAQKQLRIFILITLLISLAIQCAEVATGRFAYVWLSNGFAIDEKLIGGATGVFRSKGLFAGPTSAAAYSIVCALFFARSPVMLVAVAGVAVMSGSKSGLLFLIVAGTVLAIGGTRRERFALVGSIVTAGIIVTILAAKDAIDPLAVQRTLEVIDFGASGNQSRYYFWDATWSAFVEDFSDTQRFFGWPRGSRDLFGNTTESQYLQILLDFGIVGLSIYAVALVLVARRVTRDRMTLAAFIGFTVVAAVTPLFDQAGLCILFWIFVFRTLMFPLETGRSSAFGGVREALGGLIPRGRVASAASAARSRSEGDAASVTPRRTRG